MAPKEVFAHRNKCSKVRDGVWRKVMDLSTKEIQEPAKEWMWRQGETSFHMSREENPLAVARRRLNLSLW
jgi:hypothetical protein